MRPLLTILLLVLPGCYLSHGASTTDASPPEEASDAGLVVDATPHEVGLPSSELVIRGLAPLLGWDGEGIALITGLGAPSPAGMVLHRFSPDLHATASPVALVPGAFGAASWEGGIVGVCGRVGDGVELRSHDITGTPFGAPMLVADVQCAAVQRWGERWAVASVFVEGRSALHARLDWLDDTGALVRRAPLEGWDALSLSTALARIGDDLLVAWVTTGRAVRLMRLAPDGSTRADTVFEAGDVDAVSIAVDGDGRIGVLVDASWSRGDLSFSTWTGSLEREGDRHVIADGYEGIARPRVVATAEGWAAAFVDHTEPSAHGTAFVVQLDSAGTPVATEVIAEHAAGQLGLALLYAAGRTYVAVERSGRPGEGQHIILRALATR